VTATGPARDTVPSTAERDSTVASVASDGDTMTAFVTGASGFVGTHLSEHLSACGDTVHGPLVEITDRDALLGELRRCQPDVVYHLAGQAHVGQSWHDPRGTFTTNALGTLACVDAAAAYGREHGRAPVVIVVSSAEVYGRVVHLPIDEAHPAEPTTPYGASKLAAEIAALQIWRSGGAPVIVARPFNHIGPGQSPAFAISGFAKRIAEAERSGSDELTVGNLTTVRDFTDVRDVVRAYRLLARRGVPGRTYNIGSGVGTVLADAVQALLNHAARPLTLRTDPELLRPSDVPELVCDASRLRADTGWEPLHDVSASAAALLAWWRERL
jgi:GDP-4-dehydro-6-deoxy-D-mannose reductase